MAVAAAAAGLDAQHIALPEDIAVAQRSQDSLVIGAAVDDGPAGTARHAAGNAPWRVLDAVDAERQHGFLGQHVVLAHDAAAAAILPGAARIPEDAIRPEPYRIADLQELDGIVLLRHEIDRVGAVGGGPGAPTHADAVGHQERLQISLIVAVGAAHERDNISRVSGRRLAAGYVYEAVHRGEEAHQGEAAHAERRREPWPQQRALAQPHLVERLRAAGIAHLGRIAAEIEHGERRAR